jgi:hypothetical protein
VGRRVDPDNRVEPAVIDPRRSVRSDNYAVRRRSAPERDLVDLTGSGVETAEHAFRCAVYQTPPSGAGATSCGPLPEGRGKSVRRISATADVEKTNNVISARRIAARIAISLTGRLHQPGRCEALDGTAPNWASTPMTHGLLEEIGDWPTQGTTQSISGLGPWAASLGDGTSALTQTVQVWARCEVLD